MAGGAGVRADAVTFPSGVSAVCVAITGATDIVAARQQGRMLATALGFSPGDATLVATAISELARNIVLYAKRGEIVVAPITGHRTGGLVIAARDEGDGIHDIGLALQAGYSTGGGLGVGLPGVKTIMDEFEIVSEIGRGTTVTVKKWKTDAAGSMKWNTGDGGPKKWNTGDGRPMTDSRDGRHSDGGSRDGRPDDDGLRDS